MKKSKISEEWMQKFNLLKELFLENGGNLYKYNVPTYEDLCNAVDDIFSLKDSPIEELEKYRF